MNSTNILVVIFGGIISLLLLLQMPNKADEKVKFEVYERPDGITCVYAHNIRGLALTCDWNGKKKVGKQPTPHHPRAILVDTPQPHCSRQCMDRLLLTYVKYEEEHNAPLLETFDF